MPPLILHNVPEDELYTGDDGVQRPFAMLFVDNDGNSQNTRPRRTILETGSFGKSTKRSRSRTGTPAAKREDPTLVAAESIFTNFFAQRIAENPESSQRASNIPAGSLPNNHLGASSGQSDGTSGSNSKISKHRIKEPTEVILRGFKSSQQYAAIREYERIGGRICEDYPRDPPVEHRKFKADPGDPASLRQRPLTPEEKVKVNKFAGGEHWIKVTFESYETAEAAVGSSPQKILGHIIFAEFYRGSPPVDEEILETGQLETSIDNRSDISRKLLAESNPQTLHSERPSSLLVTSSSIQGINHNFSSLLSSDSNSFSATVESGTIASTETSSTISGSAISSDTTGDFCQRIPTARRLKLLPAEQALLPQQSPIQKFLSSLPFIGWVSRDIIGGSIPRTEQGEFDYHNASMYWKLIWLIEKVTGILLLGDPKDE